MTTPDDDSCHEHCEHSVTADDESAELSRVRAELDAARAEVVRDRALSAAAIRLDERMGYAAGFRDARDAAAKVAEDEAAAGRAYPHPRVRSAAQAIAAAIRALSPAPRPATADASGAEHLHSSRIAGQPSAVGATRCPKCGDTVARAVPPDWTSCFCGETVFGAKDTVPARDALAALGMDEPRCPLCASSDRDRGVLTTADGLRCEDCPDATFHPRNAQPAPRSEPLGKADNPDWPPDPPDVDANEAAGRFLVAAGRATQAIERERDALRAEVADLRATAKRREPWKPGQPEWRTGGSPGTHGQTLYRRNDLAALFLDASRAAHVVATLNATTGPIEITDLRAKLAEAEKRIADIGVRDEWYRTSHAYARADELEKKLAAAEQRIAELESKR